MTYVTEILPLAAVGPHSRAPSCTAAQPRSELGQHREQAFKGDDIGVLCLHVMQVRLMRGRVAIPDRLPDHNNAVVILEAIYY